MTTVWTPFRQTLANAEALSWLGIKHANHAMDKRVGIDCVHYVYAILFASQVVSYRDLGHYSITDGIYSESRRLTDAIGQCLFCDILNASSETPKFGDIVAFKTGGTSAHCGFTDGHSVFHSLAGHCVTRSPWSHWRHKAEWIIRLTDVGWKDDPISAINAMGGQA